MASKKQGSTSRSDLTSQHKRMAMGDNVPQGTKPVRLKGGGAVKKPVKKAVKKNMGGAAMKKMKRGSAPGGMNMGGAVKVKGSGAAAKKMKRGTSPGRRGR